MWLPRSQGLGVQKLLPASLQGQEGKHRLLSMMVQFRRTGGTLGLEPTVRRQEPSWQQSTGGGAVAAYLLRCHIGAAPHA